MYIRTSRLLIRDYKPSDWMDIHEIFSDPEVMKDCEPVYSQVKTKETLAFFIKNSIGYAVCLAGAGKVIGHILFHQLPGEEEGIYEIGWFFNRNFWRQGYGFEASHAMICYGFETLNLHKITAQTIDPVKSVNLMQKLGMTHEGTLHSHVKDPNGKWRDVYWYAILN